MPPTQLYRVVYSNLDTGKRVVSVRMSKADAKRMAAAVREKGGRPRIYTVPAVDRS